MLKKAEYFRGNHFIRKKLVKGFAFFGTLKFFESIALECLSQ